jgi:hypothetical protein
VCMCVFVCACVCVILKYGCMFGRMGHSVAYGNHKSSKA